jgi:hypothetical protein
VVYSLGREDVMLTIKYRQATQEQTKDSSRYGEGQGCGKEKGEIDESLNRGIWVALGVAGMEITALCLYASRLSSCA